MLEVYFKVVVPTNNPWKTSNAYCDTLEEVRELCERLKEMGHTKFEVLKIIDEYDGETFVDRKVEELLLSEGLEMDFAFDFI